MFKTDEIFVLQNECQRVDPTLVSTLLFKTDEIFVLQNECQRVDPTGVVQSEGSEWVRGPRLGPRRTAIVHSNPELASRSTELR